MYADEDGDGIGGGHNGDMTGAAVIWFWGGMEGGAC